MNITAICAMGILRSRPSLGNYSGNPWRLTPNIQEVAPNFFRNSKLI